MHLCTLYTTPPSPGLMKKDQESVSSVTTCPSVCSNTKKCNYFTRDLFYTHKRTFLVLCTVHVGTAHMHVYTCFPVSTLLHSQSHSCAFRLQYCCPHGLESTWRQGCLSWRFDTILYCHLVVLEIILSHWFKWYSHEVSFISFNKIPVRWLLLCFSVEAVRQLSWH